MVLILFIPIRLKISYIKNEFDITIKIGFIKFKIPKKKAKKKKDDKKTEDTEAKKDKPKKDDGIGAFIKFFAALQGFYDSSDRIKKTIVIERLELTSSFGTEDAAFTGMAVGLAYAEVYKLIGFLSVIFTVKTPKIEISPIFEDRNVFNIECKSIIKTKLAHIIFTALKFIKGYKKALKGKD